MKTEWKILLTCAVLLSSCGMLKEKKTLLAQDHQFTRNNQENITGQSWQKDNTLLLDTSNSEFVVQITPLGKFLYSTEKGFEGMAEKVVVKGKANKRQTVHRHKEAGHQLERQINNAENEKLKVKVQQVDKRWKPSLAMVGMVVIILLGLVFWVLRKWRLI